MSEDRQPAASGQRPAAALDPDRGANPAVGTARLPGRRAFLVGTGLDVEARRARALELRLTTAHQQLGDPVSPTPSQRRRGRYGIVGLATFTKALPHNPLGGVDPAAYRALLRALRSGRADDFTRIPLGGTLGWVA